MRQVSETKRISSAWGDQDLSSTWFTQSTQSTSTKLLLLGTTALWLAACSTPVAVPGSDAGLVDAAEPADGATHLPDSGLASSVTGTVLDDLTVESPDTLDLCSRRMPEQFHVVLPRLVRSGLQPWELLQGSVDGVLVEKGNLAAQRWRPTATTRSLLFYGLEQSGTTFQLRADLVHDLGAPGQLLESYYVSRTPDRTEPVKLDGSKWEVDFFHKPPGGESAGLVGCQGDPKYASEPLVRVLHAVSRFNEHLVLTGFFTAQRAGLADELDLYFTGMRLLSSADSMPTDVSDFFAYTRNAKGETVVDLRQEPRLFHTVFRPLAEGVSDPNVPIPERTPERIVIPDDGGRSWDPEWIEVTIRKSDGTQTTENWDVRDRYFRVDAAELTRTARASCETPKVFLVGYFQPNGVTDSFQLVTCPAAAAPGYSLLAVVPVWFGANPALVGTRFDKGITPYQVSGRAGHRVPLGSFTATFTTADGKSFTQEIVDANGKVVGTYTSEASELSQYTGIRVETLKAAAGDVSMTLVRQWAGVGVGKSSVYAPLSFSLSFSGRTVLVDAMDALRYANSHHNWEDSLEARAEGLVLRWRTSFQTGKQHEVQVRTDAGQELLSWTELKQQ